MEHEKKFYNLKARSKTFVIYFSAPYFIDCISEQDLDELNIEIIRNTLYKVGLAHDNVLSILVT